MQHELPVRCQLPGHNGAGRAGYEVQEGLRRAVGGDRERVRPAALSVQPDLTEPGYATIAPARSLAAGRTGPGRRCGKLGQVAQRVGEMLRAERRELEVLPDGLRHRRPVVGERDLSLGRTERRKVVTPEPAAELQVTVPLGVVPRHPANGVRWVEHVDLVGRLVVTVWMAGVI